LHASFAEHGLPSLHVVPSATGDQSVVNVIGAQTSHAFAGLMVPAP
jgi:hypothetical protein